MDGSQNTAPTLSRKLGDAFRSRWTRRVGIGVVAFVALYALLGFFAAPPLIKSVAEKQLAEQLGRPVTIGHVALNPFLLRLQTDDVHIGGREAGEAFVDVGQLVVRLSWETLARFAPVVDELHVVAPRVQLIRTDAAHFNFSDLTETSPPADTEDSRPLDLVVRQFSVTDGAILWSDRSTGRPTDLALEHLAASLENFTLAGPDGATYALSADLASGGAIKAEGRLDLAAQSAAARLSVDGLALKAAQSYLAAATPARLVDGTASAAIDLDADWSKSPMALTLTNGSLGLSGVQIALPDANASALSLASANVAIAKVDLAAQTVAIENVAVAGFSADVRRLADGTVDLAALAGTPDAQAEPPPAAPAWHYTIGEIAFTEARATFTDATAPSPTTIELAPLNLTLRQVSDDPSSPLPVTLAATLNGKGTVALEGTVTRDPLKVDLKLAGQSIDVTPFAPYATRELNARIARAVVNAKGDVGFAENADGLQASYRGDVELADVRVINRATNAPFAGWRSLALSGLTARYDSTGGVDLDAARVVFANFFGRVLLDEQGQLHLRDILAKDSAATAQAAEITAAPNPSGPEGPPMRLHFGRLELQDGQVTYADNFITPNYTAELTAINGTIGTFGTGTTTPAPIDVGAQLTANGPISITGRINPLVASPSLDVTAVAKEIQLTNLAAYSAKYTGYPITKGKLNVNLHYRLADDRLTADNHIFIDQLTFGERVQNDTATDLPVQLAIALLKNSKGQIDVDIPVSGSLNDPQFSVGDLVWNAVANLVKKAITAPFTLLARAFGGGGGEELGYIEFAPGSADLAEPARNKLDTITRMLADKTSVDIDLSGRVDPEVDVPALRDATVQRLVRREKIRDLAEQGRRPEPSTVKVEPSEYERYLAEAYREAKTNQLQTGPARTTPPTRAEMEAVVAREADIDASRLNQLAQDRAQAVRTYLAGKIADTRMYIVAPKLTPEGIDDGGAPTRVDLSLN